MGEQRVIKVYPIYGWGWFIDGKPRFEIPEPFEMTCRKHSNKEWSGDVITPGHEFQGRSVRISQRHVEWTGNVNVEVEPSMPEGASSSGFAMLSDFPA